MNAQGKELLTSKTFWGLVIGALAMLLQNYGVHLDVSQTAADLVGVIGMVMSVAGLVVRKGTINSVFGIKTPAGKAADAAKSAATPAANQTTGAPQ